MMNNPVTLWTRRLRATAAGALLLGVWVSALAQGTLSVETGFKSVSIGRGGDSPPIIDGRLDEGDWQRAALIEDLHQIVPTEYAQPTEPTRIRVYYDDDALYIGARMLDSQPEAMNTNVLRQGAQFWGDDFFAVIIDPFNDKRNGYRFQLNANGIRMQALYQDTTRQDWNWNGIWYGAAAIDDGGWTAEIAIPFKTLSFNPQNDTWGINFSRDLGRLDERSGWVSRNSNQDPSIAGEAVGFTDLALGRGLDIVPSITLRQKKTYGPSERASDTDPSLDVFYKFTPSLNGALTLNTDFSATEVDDRQVELTRFSLFFPEKRTFFLRDSDIFRFGRVGALGRFGIQGTTLSRPDLENGRPYFSRRIGLSATGRPVDLDVGGKLSGRVGRWNVGALAIRQDQFEAIDATDIFVGCIAANVLEESSAGIIVTDGDSRSNRHNSLVGVDFLYNNTRLPGGRALQGEAWYQQSDTEGIDTDQSAYGLRLRAPNTIGFRGGIGVKEIEDNFFPALGFINRAGIRDRTFELGYTHRSSAGLLRDIFSGIDAQRIDLINGDLQTQIVTLRALEFETHTRDRATIRLHATKEALTEPFIIWNKGSDEVIVPPGTYSFDEAEVSVASGNPRKVWGSLSYRAGDFFDGERVRLGAGIGWRPTRHFQTTLDYELNDVELPDGNFITRLVQLRTDVVFSATMSWVTLLQYDNVTETMGINTRLHWIPEAGREAFVVLNHNLSDADLNNRFDSTLADLAIKFNYTFRF